MLRFKRVYNLSMVQKIALAGIFIILIALFQKIFAVNYIPVLPFVRISFGGPALIIFSSILLGPWFGLLVGAASDIVGFYIFDPKMFGSAPFFQITFIYALLGFASFFIYKFFQVVKNEKLLLTIEVVVFTLLFIVGFLRSFTNRGIALEADHSVGQLDLRLHRDGVETPFLLNGRRDELKLDVFFRHLFLVKPVRHRDLGMETLNFIL